MKMIFITLIALVSVTSFAQDDFSRSETTADGRRSGDLTSGIFFEPMLVYEASNTKIETSDLPLIGGDSTGKSTGFGIGARLGVHVWESIFLAADARYGRSELSESMFDNTRSDQYNYGVTAGLQTPIAGLRVWGTYILGGDMNPEAGENGLDLRFRDLTGYRIGAGLYVKAVSINLEYQRLAFNKTRVESWGNLDVDRGFDVDTKLEGYTVGLSFPFTL